MHAYYPLVVVFLMAFAWFLCLNLFASDWLIGYDVYYHARHAASLWRGEAMSLPVFSTISREQSDLYYLYHWSLAPFTAWFTGDNYQALITGTKIHNALAIATMLSVFFWLLRSLLKESGAADSNRTTSRATLGTVLLLAISPMFRIRLFDARPHIVSITLLLLIVYFLWRQKKWPIFVIAAISPLTYSVSFFVLIPVVLYILSDWLFYRTRYPSRTAASFSLMAIAGLIFGILLHPDPQHYLFNAYSLHARALITNYTEHLPEGSELSPLEVWSGDWLWVAVIVASVITQLGPSTLRKKPRTRQHFFEYYLLIQAAFFTPLAVIVSRTVEYAVPFVILYSTLVLARSSTVSMAQLAHRLHFLKFLRPLRRRPAIVILALVLYASIALSLKARSFSRYIPPPDATYQAAQIIKENSEMQDIVFFTAFSDYPQLVFFNNDNRYITGMGAIFTYAFSPQKYWLWQHTAAADEKICAAATCEESTHDLHQAIAQEFGAKFVYLNFRHNVEPLRQKLATDPRFTEVFRDSAEPEIMVYKVNEP